MSRYRVSYNTRVGANFLDATTGAHAEAIASCLRGWPGLTDVVVTEIGAAPAPTPAREGMLDVSSCKLGLAALLLLSAPFSGAGATPSPVTGNLIELRFVACLTDTDQCVMRRLVLVDVSVQTCTTQAKWLLAQWAGAHPTYTVRHWLCTDGHGSVGPV
jgi:hypothetical protein